MDLRDLPVSVEVAGRLGEEITAVVEREAGWQVVAPEGPPTPALSIVDHPRPDRACVVVVAGAPDADTVRTALQAGAIDVLGWPADRQRLLDAATRAVHATTAAPRVPVLRVGGVAGGVGMSTVVLAVGGLLAWWGRRTVVVGDDDLLTLCGAWPWQGPDVADLAALDARSAAQELAAVVRRVPGVRGLSVLGGGGHALGSTAGWPVDAVVADVPRLTRAELVVARPDGALRRLAASTAAVVIVGEGPLDAAGVRRLLGRPPLVWLPASARVSRAGLAGRVPSALPGSWLAPLRKALREVLS